MDRRAFLLKSLGLSAAAGAALLVPGTDAWAEMMEPRRRWWQGWGGAEADGHLRYGIYDDGGIRPCSDSVKELTELYDRMLDETARWAAREALFQTWPAMTIVRQP